MAKYRKKPVVVDAVQVNQAMTINTLEGDMVANPGDWIVTGTHGERYPVKRDIFDEIYELVPDEDKTITVLGVGNPIPPTGYYHIQTDMGDYRTRRPYIRDNIRIGKTYVVRVYRDIIIDVLREVVTE